jgi:hypothetical protein
MALYNYSPEAVIVVVGGLPIDGFAPGTMVACDVARDSVAFSEGATGLKAKVTRTSIPLGTIKMTLMQGSRGNSILTQLFTVQQATSGVASLPCSVVNINGGESVIIAQGAITRPPMVQFADTDQTREWTIGGETVINAVGAIV